jgi:hypothetical protein
MQCYNSFFCGEFMKRRKKNEFFYEKSDSAVFLFSIQIPEIFQGFECF